METIEKAALRKAREEVNLNCRFQTIISIEETIFPNVLKVSNSIPYALCYFTHDPSPITYHPRPVCYPSPMT